MELAKPTAARENTLPMTEQIKSGATFIGDPVYILEHEVQEWCKHWQVDEAQQGREALEALNAMTSPMPMPEPITGSIVIQAGKSFKAQTVAPDGFHPRHFGMLSVPAADALAALLNAVEWTGKFPTQVTSVIIGLIDKPAGGTRPIGFYRALFRA